MIPWNNGPVNWSQVNGQTNVAQLWTGNPDLKGFTYWWRNMLPGEELAAACLDFWKFTLNLAQFGANIISVQVREWTPNGQAIIQDRGFIAEVDNVTIFSQS
jgi:hypothetical protein